MSISFSEDEKLIVEKIQSYCLYQERCIKEVKNKLFFFKVSPKFVNDLTKHLIENDYNSSIKKKLKNFSTEN